MTVKPASGTKEWSNYSVNIVKGCKHNCRYCYAAAMALRFRRIHDRGSWEVMEINESALNKGYAKHQGTIMFPTTHDIVPDIIDQCVMVLRKMLQIGNRVLIVSKPHLDCIRRICTDLDEFKDQILFRFTIGTNDNEVLRFWEPNAPSYHERLESLKYAFEHGFRTSVSCEPMLDENGVDLFYELKPFITHSFWFGKLNHPEIRIDTSNWTEEDWKYLARVERSQTDEEIRKIYTRLKGESLVRWKDSFKEVLGIARPIEHGLDK